MFEFIRKWYYRNLSNPPSAVLLLQFITIYLLVCYGSGVFGPLIAALVLAFIFERPVSFMVKQRTALPSCMPVCSTEKVIEPG